MKTISLSATWTAISSAMYDQSFINDISNLLKRQGAQKILECGCGNGHILKGLADNGFWGIGIDLDKEMIEMALKRNNHPQIRYYHMNWLDVAQLKETFDAVMCRGNNVSVGYCWGMSSENFDPKIAREVLIKSLKEIFAVLNPDGLLYLDTTSQKEIDNNGGEKKIDVGDIHIESLISYDWSRRLRSVYGKGWVGDKYFEGTGISYLITLDELKNLIQKVCVPEKIWFPDVPSEINYQPICVKKMGNRP